MKLKNKFLIYLAKTLGLILYWALVALFVWLFYDSYQTEGKWLHQFVALFFACLGCAIKPFVLTWLFEKEWQELKQKHEKTCEKLEKVLMVNSCIFGGLAILFFGIGIGVLPMVGIWLYGLLKILIYAWPCWLVLAVLSLLCLAMRASTSPVVRIVRKLIYRVLLLLTVAQIVYLEIFYVWENLGGDDLNADAIGGAGVILLALGVTLLVMFFTSLKKGIFTFATNKFVLFLRAFKNDDDKLYNKICQAIPDVPLMKIGNPNTTESENVNEHWLPLSNWKFFLKFYIAKAKAIIIAISTTEGVLWEVVQNLKQLDKCVFHFDSLDELCSFKENLQAINAGHLDVVIRAIELILHSGVADKAFVIRDNTVYVGDVTNLTNAVLANQFHDLTHLDARVATDQNSRKHKGIMAGILEKLHILNLLNSVEGIHNAGLRGVLMAVAMVVGGAIYLAYFLFTLILLCAPFIIFFEESFADIHIVGKIILSVGFCRLGWSCLKDIYETIKKK